MDWQLRITLTVVVVVAVIKRTIENDCCDNAERSWRSVTHVENNLYRSFTCVQHN